MTTLRRALPGLYKGESIRALSALVFAALLIAGQPAWASHGGGGGGGHAGGGGGHASGGGHSGGGGHPSAGHMSTGPSHGPTAHPVGPGGFHGPIRGFGGHGFDGRGRFFGHHDFDGRFGFGFPFGFGFGLGLGFGWDYPWGWGPGFYGTYGYYDPWWYGGGYYPGYYGGGGSSSYSSPRTRDEMGALKLDVTPGDAEVYLNGEYVGRARDFSGWRQDLWLEKGTYDVVLYRDGFKTLARQVTIYPGLVITWDDRLERGQSVRPEDLQSKSHERRDSRLQFERDRAERLDREGQAQRGGPYGGPYYDDRRPAPGDDSNGYDDPRGHRQGDQRDQGDGDSGGWNGNWRDRVNRDRGGNGAEPQRNARPAPAPGPTTAAITSDRYGRLHLRIEPDDASVYLDGRFVGTGSDLAGNGNGLVLAPGRHKLAVVRPGRKAEERDFEAVLGKDVDLTVNLSESNR